ncbi:MAG TPA: ATP-binding protein [Gemmatimonadaceae bacterium]|nr:ATP-binding protein [Gemmatimonadaceae bacterium]
MSSATRDRVAVAPGQQLSGERLAELLSVISEANEFSTAAAFLVAQFADVANAARGCILSIDPQQQQIETVAFVGFAPDQKPVFAIPLAEERHPLVAATLSLRPVSCSKSDVLESGIPFDHWIAIPFPQPQFKGAVEFIQGERIDALALKSCSVHLADPRERRRRAGHAPAGVVVLEARLDEDLVTELFHAASLAGPVLSRMFAVEEYRRSAERLDQQRDLLSALINSLPDPIIITSSTTDIVVQNKRAEHLLSMKERDSEGRRRAVEINNLLFTSHLAKTAMGAAVEAGARELNMVDPDEGADLLFEVLTHHLDPETGIDPGSVVSVLRDVTDLRRAAGELERQVQRARVAEKDVTRERDRLDLILENVADPILVTDDRSNIILMNRQAEALFSLAMSEEKATPGTRRERAQSVRANDTKFTTFISDFTIHPEPSRREEMSLTVPDSGVELPVEVVSGKIFNARGEPMAIVSVLHDLTEQAENERLYRELKTFSSQLEDRIRAATSDLAAQNARLQWQSQELEKANRLKSEFLASMSHELRTPINALIGYTALILDRIYGDVNDRQIDALTRIHASAQHLLVLINDILDLAKIEAGRMPLHLEELELRHLLLEVTLQMDPLFKKKGLRFSWEMSRESVVMRTDRTKVKQIMLNLLSNAVKFTHRGTVSVSAEVANNFVSISVADTGIGIAEEHLVAIWEDFRQVDQSSTREFGGTGLGLSITKKLVEALGGHVDLRSTLGEGSTFTVTLPRESEYSAEDDDSLLTSGESVVFVGTAEGPTRPIRES